MAKEKTEIKKTVSKQQVKNAASSQKYLPFREIRDGIVILQDGTLRRVMLVSSLNFALKSQDEQQGIIQGYVQFLNGLDFELQIVVQSRQLNIDAYLHKLDELKNLQTNELLKRQTASYQSFVETLVKGSNIMDKKFYVVIPFSPTSKKRKSFWSRFQDVIYPASALTLSEKKFQKYKEEVDRRVSQVNGGLSAIGLQCVMLDTQALIELYYNTFNPHSSASQHIGDIEEMRIDRLAQ